MKSKSKRQLTLLDRRTTLNKITCSAETIILTLIMLTIIAIITASLVDSPLSRVLCVVIASTKRSAV